MRTSSLLVIVAVTCVLLLVVCVTRAAAEAPPRVAVERLADLPIPAAGGGLLSLSDGRLAYAGGTTWTGGKKRWLTEVFLYNPEIDRWEPGPALPAPADASVPLPLRVEGRWVLLGGERDDGVGSQAVALIEGAGGLRWETLPELPFRKAAAAGGSLRGTLLVVGGADDRDSYAVGRTTVWAGERAGSAERWMWRQLDDFPGRAHSVAAGAVFGDRLYVFGGLYAEAAGGPALDSDEAMSFALDEGWRPLRPMPSASRGATAVGVDGVGIVIAGGWSGDGPRSDVFVYRPDADDYENVATLPTPVAVASGVAVGRDVYLAGNEDKARSRRPDFFRLRFAPDEAAPASMLRGEKD